MIRDLANKLSNGRISIVEYSDMSDEKKHQYDKSNNLLYCMGNPAIHLFNRSFIEEITSGKLSLPYHVAKKKIKAFMEGMIKEIPGYKFEKFVFDALPMSSNSFILEIISGHDRVIFFQLFFYVHNQILY